MGLSPQHVLDQGTKSVLRLLGKAGAIPALDDPERRKKVERMIHKGSSAGFRGAEGAAKAVGTVSKRAFPRKRATGEPKRTTPAARKGVFDLTPTEDQAMIQEACRDLADEVIRDAGAQADAERALPEVVRESAAQIGLTLLGVPTDLGGIAEEHSALTGVLAIEELARGDMGIATALMAPTSVATALAMYGDASQQETFLPAFTGDNPPAAAAIAFMEPQPIFDAMRPATTGRIDGADIILDGTKALVPGAEDAELFIVSAMVGGVARMVIVEPGAAGVSVEDDPAMGVRAARTGRLVLRQVRVPKANLLGDGAAHRDAVLRARLAWSAAAVGTCQAALDQLIPYVKERKAFGEPIAYRQTVAFMISDIATELAALRLVVWRAASRLDSGKGFASEDAARDIASARALAAQHGSVIGSNAVQLLGGHGFVKEWGNERWYRDLRGAGLLEGALLV